MNTRATLVIAATQAELSRLIERLHARPDRPVQDFPVYRAAGGSSNLLLVISGPGMANAGAACAAAIERFQPARIFNIGICGIYAQDSPLPGTAVIGRQAVFADTGAAGGAAFTTLEQMGLPLAQHRDKAVYNALALDHGAAPAAVPRAGFLTVAAVSATPGRARELSSRFPGQTGDVLCEDMESAAVALIALRAGIPCSVARGISNLCGERDHACWKIVEAARAAQELLLNTLKSTLA